MRCGTIPYAAPEVLLKPYYAEPADLWSCGIVFVAMLAGELPWDAPKDQCKEYASWKADGAITQSPWTKLSNMAYSLARKILAPDPCNRPTLNKILEHTWMNVQFNKTDYYDETDCTTESKCKQRASIADNENTPQLPTVVLSQPAPRSKNIELHRLATLLQNREQVCFSQPTQNDDLILGSQIPCTQSPLTQNNFQKLIKRMTRFHVTTCYEKTIAHLCKALDKLHYVWSSDPSGVVTISTTDMRKMQLVFKANIIDMDGKLLLDFRLSKGCGLEFKKSFMKIKVYLTDIRSD